MPHVSLKDIAGRWSEIQDEVRDKFELLDITYSTWIKPLVPYSLKEKKLFISFPNDSIEEKKVSNA